jgi:hypothetical protein
VLREGINFSSLSKANIFAGLPTYAVVYIVKINIGNCPLPPHTQRKGK